MHAQCAMAKTINMGGYWTQERLHAAGYAPSPLCTRCGLGAVDNEIHRFWQCPANSLIDSINISSTQYLIALASSQHSTDPALWCRGVAVNYLDNPDNMSPKPHQIYHRSPLFNVDNKERMFALAFSSPMALVAVGAATQGLCGLELA